MSKELTDRIKNEIVTRQIKFLKSNYPNELINYNTLKKYLSESLKNYSSKKLEINETVDFELLKNLQEGKSRVTARLFDAAMYINNISYRYDVKDKHLITLYENNKEARKWSRGYGVKTSELLVKYLTKKGLI